MTTPHQPQPHTDGIPDEIMKAADAALVSAILELDDQNGNSTAIIAKAILAERQRCASIAEGRELTGHPRLSPGSEMNAWWSGQEAAGAEIAAAIRSPSTTQSQTGRQSDD